MSDSPVVSVKIAKPPPEPLALEPPPEERAVSGISAQQATGWPQQPCLLAGASSAIGAGVLGFFFGAIPSMLRNRRLNAYQLWVADGWRSTLGLGLVSGAYTWVHCLATRIRMKDDGWNRGVAGCATGLLLGWQGGPASAFQSCAGLGLVSYIVDFAGAGDTPPASAATLDDHHPHHQQSLSCCSYSSPGHLQAGHGCGSACCSRPSYSGMVAPAGGSPLCSSSSCCAAPSDLSRAMAALARAACSLAGAPGASDAHAAPPRLAPPGSQRRGVVSIRGGGDVCEPAVTCGNRSSTQRDTAAGQSQGAGPVVAPSARAVVAEVPRARGRRASDARALVSLPGGTPPQTAVANGAPGPAAGGADAPRGAGAPGSLASITCNSAGAGMGGQRQLVGALAQGPRHAAATAAALLAWPSPAGAAQLPPVMWLGHVLARPYFSVPT